MAVGSTKWGKYVPESRGGKILFNVAMVVVGVAVLGIFVGVILQGVG